MLRCIQMQHLSNPLRLSLSKPRPDSLQHEPWPRSPSPCPVIAINQPAAFQAEAAAANALIQLGAGAIEQLDLGIERDADRAAEL